MASGIYKNKNFCIFEFKWRAKTFQTLLFAMDWQTNSKLTVSYSLILNENTHMKHSLLRLCLIKVSVHSSSARGKSLADYSNQTGSERQRWGPVWLLCAWGVHYILHYLRFLNHKLFSCCLFHSVNQLFCLIKTRGL